MRRINLQKNRKRKKLEDTISKILQDPREDRKKLSEVSKVLLVNQILSTYNLILFQSKRMN